MRGRPSNYLFITNVIMDNEPLCGSITPINNEIIYSHFIKIIHNHSITSFICSTFVCPTEIIAFSERAAEFRRHNCELIACSTDSHYTHMAWINTPRAIGGLGQLNIPLLADKSHSIARAYGVLNEDTGIPFRGLFIIDGTQRLRQMTINDLTVGRCVDETLRLVQAFQFTDEHGEVCPVNWKPGQRTIKPDAKDAREYFERHGKWASTTRYDAQATPQNIFCYFGIKIHFNHNKNVFCAESHDKLMFFANLYSRVCARPLGHPLVCMYNWWKWWWWTTWRVTYLLQIEVLNHSLQSVRQPMLGQTHGSRSWCFTWVEQQCCFAYNI